MTAGHHRGAGSWIAVVAACVAALQMMIGSLSPLRAAAPAFDPLLVLCAHGPHAAQPATPTPTRHDHAGDCCLAGCPMGAALPAAPPGIDGERACGSAALAPLRPGPSRLDRRPAASPRRTRGPPDTA